MSNKAFTYFCPVIFTGASQSEAITLWDVRAQKPVYELATGNTAVHSMAWDSHTSTLYAATLCEHERYRPAKIPIIKEEDGEVSRKEKKEETAQGEGECAVIEDDDDDEWKDEDDEQDDEDDEVEDDRKSDTEYEPVSEDMCWPTRAYHAENYFGHVFDAGHNRLCMCSLTNFFSVIVCTNHLFSIHSQVFLQNST